MSSRDSMLGRAIGDGRTRETETEPESEAESDSADEPMLADAAGVAARSTTIEGETVDLETPESSVTFEDVGSFRSGKYGRPRPSEFYTASQLGQTPPMQLIKITVTQQLTGGKPIATNDDGELQGIAADFGELLVDIYRGPHYHEMGYDDLITTAVSDLLESAYAYWEMIPSSDGDFPVAGFKPLPPLQIQHNVDDETGELEDEPAFYHVPYRRSSSAITAAGGADELDRDQVVVMRAPQSTRSDRMYGESVATKVREWLELIVDVDVHQKRHYSDSELPAGFLHFAGAVGDDKLEEIEQDIVEAAGDPHELVTTTSDGDASWIPVGESVVDLEAIEEQKWYFKLVLAAAGLNANELGIIEGSGFAKETPALQKAIYKKVTKPFMNAILDPQNSQAVPQIESGLSGTVGEDVRLDMERFDPVQEQVERQETLDEWREKLTSLNETRGGIGREAHEIMVDVPELGGEVNLADLPRYVVDLILDSTPEVSFGEDGTVEQESQQGPPKFEDDPVLTEREAFIELGADYDDRVVRQLEDTIEVQSSFIKSTAYSAEPEFMQITFQNNGQEAVYWYANVEEYRFFNFLRATSKGSYFNKYIRHTGDPGYPYARLS